MNWSSVAGESDQPLFFWLALSLMFTCFMNPFILTFGVTLPLTSDVPYPLYRLQFHLKRSFFPVLFSCHMQHLAGRFIINDATVFNTVPILHFCEHCSGTVVIRLHGVWSQDILTSSLISCLLSFHLVIMQFTKDFLVLFFLLRICWAIFVLHFSEVLLVRYFSL